MLNLNINYGTLLYKVIASVAVVLLAYGANTLLRRIVRLQISDETQVRTAQTLGRNTILFLGALIVLLIWLGSPGNISVTLGIVGAGFAFASQETIGSFTGYLSIVFGRIYRIGDRVSIGDVTGDVTDIGIMRTTLMEIGAWVKAEQYTGRLVTVANRAVFTDPVYNYTQYWHYVWDEIVLPITYESEWRRAAEIVLHHGQQYTEQFQADAEAELREMRKRYPIQATTVAPALYVVMTDNWIEMTLRYVVEARERRAVQAQLHHELLQHFEREPNITIASATYEIVGFPPLRHATQEREHGIRPSG